MRLRCDSDQNRTGRAISPEKPPMPCRAAWMGSAKHLSSRFHPVSGSQQTSADSLPGASSRSKQSEVGDSAVRRSVDRQSWQHINMMAEVSRGYGCQDSSDVPCGSASFPTSKLLWLNLDLQQSPVARSQGLRLFFEGGMILPATATRSWEAPILTRAGPLRCVLPAPRRWKIPRPIVPWAQTRQPRSLWHHGSGLASGAAQLLFTTHHALRTRGRLITTGGSITRGLTSAKCIATGAGSRMQVFPPF